MAGLDAKVTFCYFCIYRPKTDFFLVSRVLLFWHMGYLSTCVQIKSREFYSVTSVLGCFSNITNRSKVIGKKLLAD